jgi:hypothetical protein
MARTLVITETDIFKQAGFLSKKTPGTKDMLEDHELLSFFQECWKQFPAD